jgi:hypothetical protein
MRFDALRNPFVDDTESFVAKTHIGNLPESICGLSARYGFGKSRADSFQPFTRPQGHRDFVSDVIIVGLRCRQRATTQAIAKTGGASLASGTQANAKPRSSPGHARTCKAGGRCPP